jgi:hypothetical protein
MASTLALPPPAATASGDASRNRYTVQSDDSKATVKAREPARMAGSRALVQSSGQCGRKTYCTPISRNHAMYSGAS